MVHFVVDSMLGGGAAVKTIALVRALAAAGVRARLITTDIGLRDRPLPDLGDVKLMVIRSRWGRFPVPQVGTRGMSRFLDGCDAAILVSHWTALNAIAYRAARRRGIPVLLCPAGALRIQGRSRLLKHLYQLVVGRRLLRDAAAVVATTPLEASQFRDDGIPEGRIRVIPNGIDPELGGISADAFRSEFRLPADPLVLFIGRLNPLKGPDLLLEAFGKVASRFEDWHLVIAGRDEGLERELRRRTVASGLGNRVHFVGHLAAAEAAGAFRAASLLAVPSRHEAMSLVALEAAVVGTPVLLTGECGFSEVQHVGGGRVVSASAASLADGLSELFAERSRLPEMGARLRAFVLQHYGWPAIVAQYLSLMREVRDAPLARATE